MPAHKKHPSARARANRASTAATLTAASTWKPGLPASVREDGWHPQTLAWWSDVWDAPMSGEFHESDMHQLVVLACLMDDFFTATSRSMRTSISAEIRQHRTAFGLTPYDRRRLEWTIEQVDEAKDRGRQRRERQGVEQPAAGADPRGILRAVN